MHQHRHCALCHQTDQLSKQQRSTQTDDLDPPIRPGQAPIRLLLCEDGDAELGEPGDSVQSIGSPQGMPIDLGVFVQARSCLPQGGGPALE